MYPQRQIRFAERARGGAKVREHSAGATFPTLSGQGKGPLISPWRILAKEHMTANIVIAGARERDVDLILMEELTASPAFLRWLLGRIEVPPTSTLVEVRHSVTTQNGESDLELTLKATNGTVKVLIEDKVDAQFQPEQAKRYRERADRYLKSGECRRAVIVLVAPDAYLTNSKDKCGFDQHVSLEQIADWFRESPDVGTRRNFKTTLLAQTIARASKGWTLVPDDKCTAFWREYREMVLAIAPDLNPPPTKDRPAGSTFIYFKAKGLPKGVRVAHKLTYGNVDLEFGGMGEDMGEIKAKYGTAMDPDMCIDQTNKSAVVRVKVPVLDVAATLSSQRRDVERGIEEAARLAQWFRRHSRAKGE